MLNRRLAVAVLAGTAIVCIVISATPFVGDTIATGAAIRFLAGVFFVAVLPGAAVVLATRPRINAIEVVALGVLVSYVLTQFLVIGAMLMHWSALTSLAWIAAITVATLIVAWRRQDPIEVSPALVALIGVLVIVAGLLYIQGAPYSSSEDQIHSALVRRLAFWPHPTTSGLYFLSGVEPGFYPYPFPAIHYFIALISRAGGLDVLFVYHKLRALWGPVALMAVFMAADGIFDRRMAIVSTITAIVFVLNGTFSVSYNYFWGQLTPFSHASDVALGVLLPLLIVSTIRYATAPPDDRRWWAIAALALTFSLCIVHAREVVQQLVYLAALAAATVIGARDRRTHLRPVLMLLAATVVVAIAYRAWHSSQFGFVNDVVALQREAFESRLHSASWFDLLIGTPSPDAQGGVLLFRGWNPIILLLTPLLLLAFPGRRLVRFVSIAILLYLLIVRVNAFTIPYILASYFEITTSSMRNFIFFIHMLAGVLLWLVSQRAWRMGALGMSALALFAAGLWALFWNDFWLFAHQDVFFLPLIAALLIVLLRDWYREPDGEAPIHTSPGAIVAWATLITLLAVVTFRPGSMMASNAAGTGSPLTVPYADSIPTPGALLAQLGGGSDTPDMPVPFQPQGIVPVTSGPLKNRPIPVPLLAWAATAIPVDSVVLASKFNPYPFSVYLPVRMVAWPSMELTYHNETNALRAYYELWDHALRTHRAQPFFNTGETRDERERLLSALAVDFVAIDPNYYSSLTRILDQYPDLLSREYDDGQWAVYRVKRPA